MPRHALTALLCLALCAPGATDAAAWTAHGGWIRSDVGLDKEGEGVYLGLGGEIPWETPVLAASWVVEYAQKKGAQPTAFAGNEVGFIVEDADVTLHVVEPGVFLGARLAGLPVIPRLYTGTSIALKLKESWSDFPGVPDRRWAYKETDWIVHAGLAVDIGPAALDIRYSKSLVGQQLLGPQEIPLGKAEDPFEGVREPEEGFKTESWRVGVAFAF